MPDFTPAIDERPNDTPWPAMSWPVKDDVKLSGGAVTVSRFSSEDAEELFAALDHDAVWAHVPGRPGSPAELATAFADRAATRGDVIWVVRLLEDAGGLPAGSVVGTSSYLDVVPGSARLEIGWTT